MDQKSQSPERLTIAVDEFCNLVGVGKTTAYNLIASGQIASIKVGRRRLVIVDSVERFISLAAERGVK